MSPLSLCANTSCILAPGLAPANTKDSSLISPCVTFDPL